MNAVEYGLTGSVWTSSLTNSHRAANRMESGCICVKNVSAHCLGALFGGYTQSGIGRDEGYDELLSYSNVVREHRHHALKGGNMESAGVAGTSIEHQ